MAADGVAALHILLGDAPGLGEGEGGALRKRDLAQLGGDPVEGPAQVDRGGAGGGQGLDGMVDPGIGSIPAQAQGQAVGRRHADERRAAHDHGADGNGRFVQGGEPLNLEGEGQAGLVDDLDGRAVGGGKDGAVGFAVDVHARASRMFRAQGPVLGPCARPIARRGAINSAASLDRTPGVAPRHPGAAQRSPGSRNAGRARLFAVGGSGSRARLRRPGMTATCPLREGYELRSSPAVPASPAGSSRSPPVRCPRSVHRRRRSRWRCRPLPRGRG